MKRTAGRFVTTQSHQETVNAFVPASLPPSAPDLDTKSYQYLNTRAELALARLSGMTGLVTSGEWLIYSAIRREA
ncbi:hypothetical protein [Serratia sp. OS31]|uniref:hypothetical protein n=1 Tax=Serratia sp. OS31 TaxID=2760844 RepID=UPI0015FFA89C|nr:hypothetical protein [Serratia sp. OS31]MBB1584556.1 hypothetical protein [Serratia sp. OS31]